MQATKFSSFKEFKQLPKPVGPVINVKKNQRLDSSRVESQKSWVQSVVSGSAKKSLSRYSQSNFSMMRYNREMMERESQPVTEEIIRKELTLAFKKIKLDTYSDILRIKKPHNNAVLAGQMLCRLVNSFRGGS